MCFLFVMKKIFKTLIMCFGDKSLHKMRPRSNSIVLSEHIAAGGTVHKHNNDWRIGFIYLLAVPAIYALYAAFIHFKHQNIAATKVTTSDNLEQHPILDLEDNISTLNISLNEYYAANQYEQMTEDNNNVIVFGEYLPEYCVANTTILVPVNKTKVKLSEVEDMFKNIRMGGYFFPIDCRPKHKIAIIIPYRNREEHLAIFLRHMHKFLVNQKIEYRMFLIEQNGTEPFNQGRIYNAGFKEALKYGAWGCVLFHDVDLLPLDPRIPYACPLYARHMCASIREVTRSKYRTLFGGVSVMSVKVFKQVNGFSNMYWGWGGEDDDMYIRLKSAKIPVVRYNKEIARYTSIPHREEEPNIYRHFLLRNATSRYLEDGLSNINYTVLKKYIRPLFTHLLLDINPENTIIYDYYRNAKVIPRIKNLFKY